MTPTAPTQLVDLTALARHRARGDIASAQFLHDDAIFEIKERLIDVNRTFTKPAIVTPFANVWGDVVAGAKVVADDDVLDLTPNSHDLIIHGMGLHWANDPVGQLIQCRHALKPDGLLLVAMFGGETLNELRAVLGQAEIDLTSGLSPRVAPMGEVRDLGGLLQRAGLALPVADVLQRHVTYRGLIDLVADLRAMGETNALSARHRSFSSRAFFAHATTLYAANFPAEDNRIRATFDLIFLTGWAPDASQQKPLRPGSAKARLADALRTTEFDDTATPVLDRDLK
jgi:SAM-dependent methyltransferase